MISEATLSLSFFFTVNEYYIIQLNIGTLVLNMYILTLSFYSSASNEYTVSL